MLSADPATLAAFEAQNPDAAGIMQRTAVSATFYREAVYDQEASEGFADIKFDPVTGREIKVKVPGQGRPIYKEEIFVEIGVAGSTAELRRRPLRELDKLRFAKEWEAFEKKEAAPRIGTPLDELPFLTKAQRLEFQAYGCKTAEQLAAMSDVNGQKFMGFQQLRRRVQDYLAAAAGAAPMLEMRKELEERDAKLAELQAQIAELAKDRVAPPKRRGWPKGKPRKTKAPEAEAPPSE